MVKPCLATFVLAVLAATVRSQDLTIPYASVGNSRLIEYKQAGSVFHLLIGSEFQESSSANPLLLKHPEDLRFGGVSLGSVKFSKGAIVDGCLGMDILSKVAIGIDTESGTFSFWTKGQLKEAEARSWVTGGAALDFGMSDFVAMPFTLDRWGLPVVPVSVGKSSVEAVLTLGSYTGLFKTIANDPGPSHAYWFTGCKIGSEPVPWMNFDDLHPSDNPFEAFHLDAIVSTWNLSTPRVLVDFPAHRLYFPRLTDDGRSTYILDWITDAPLRVSHGYITFGGPRFAYPTDIKLLGCLVKSIADEPAADVVKQLLHPGLDSQKWMFSFIEKTRKAHQVKYVDSDGKEGVVFYGSQGS